MHFGFIRFFSFNYFLSHSVIFSLCYISHLIRVLHETECTGTPVLFVMEYYSCIVQRATVVLCGFMTINRIELNLNESLKK